MTTSTEAFEMQIEDIFKFRDGRTVFVGEIVNGPTHIDSCRCELLHDGSPVTTIMAEGEMSGENDHPRGYRAVATSADVDVAYTDLENGRWVLRAV
ncbi:MAG: hypothetical protein ACYTF9_05420 [Planctomycetota bacterium]|jgi:hypothetical protein